MGALFLSRGEHEPDCKWFPTGWLCVTTCPEPAIEQVDPGDLAPERGL